MKMNPQGGGPTEAQRTALRRFAEYNGRTWKTALRHCWETGDYSVAPSDIDYSLLQQVRNSYGPAWLQKYKDGIARGNSRRWSGRTSHERFV